MKIKVCFYKGKGGLFSKLIHFKQRRLPKRFKQYSHVEIQMRLYGNPTSFSSSAKDKGVRFKEIQYNMFEWDSYEIDIPNDNFNKMISFAKKEIRNGYDWKAIILSMIFNVFIGYDNRRFCSEICTRLLQEAGLLCGKDSLFTTPGQLAIYLEELGYRVKIY